jgi:hypothetical protein
MADWFDEGMKELRQEQWQRGGRKERRRLSTSEIEGVWSPKTTYRPRRSWGAGLMAAGNAVSSLGTGLMKIVAYFALLALVALVGLIAMAVLSGAK